MRTVAFTALYYVLAYTLWTRYNKISNLSWGLLYFLTSYFSFVCAVSVHNTVHCPVFYNKMANKVFQVVLSLGFGLPVSNYVPGHNLSHHQNTQTPKDAMRTTKLRFKWHFLNGLLFGPIIAFSMIGQDATYFNVQRKNLQPIFKQMKVEQIILVTYYLVFAILDFKKFVVCLLIPHIIAKFSIISLNILQHDGCDPESTHNHARNFVSPVLNFFCYNNGYHSIHHMHPGWHWSILKEKHDELVKPHIHPNLDQPSILAYMFKTFIFPGLRIDYLGKKLKVPPYVPDQEWFFASTETYSSKGDTY